MIEETIPFLEQFPKTERFVLGAKIREQMYEILKGLITAQKKFHKRTTLEKVDVDLEVLRALIRIAYRLKYLSHKKYGHWAKMVEEIGKMLGGWLKASQ